VTRNLKYAPSSPRRAESLHLAFPADGGTAPLSTKSEDGDQIIHGQWEVTCTYRGRSNYAHREDAPLRVHTTHEKHFRDSILVGERVAQTGGLVRNHRRKASKILKKRGSEFEGLVHGGGRRDSAENSQEEVGTDL